ncbi:hypothetical protein TEA_008169 [Camellia sinensis var. sinensis]|uniref:PGG domain-containing protein n=1 Tax=Camellia sinensis var. sinensis TaxID=542762 RepID=A0A4S4EKI1_CAMSN|nr:hypothetical protein TEA_008169 [Camellia sinensis var. sinensis]
MAKYEQHKTNRHLYEALMGGDGKKVIELCKQIPEGPLHILTIHNDTVLHMAIYSKQKQLVRDLLEELHNRDIQNMTLQNDIGNTVLHEAATSNRIVLAAKEMLQKAPKLLSMHNRRGETALFRAARYGKLEMFKFLDGEVKRIFGSEGEEEVEEEGRKVFYERDDKTTILHISILTEHFDLALLIAIEHGYLVGVKDGDGMTALQLLACNPSAFEDGSKQRCLKRLIRSLPLWEAIKRKKTQYESALKLAKFLIARDISWEATESAIDQSKPKTHKYVRITRDTSWEGGRQKAHAGQTRTIETAETPLFLAAKYGIIEIVKEILDTYPQAIEHIDDHGRNILHVAIKYRQIHVFDYVVKMEIPMTRLIRKIDNNGNSILHMVGIKADDFIRDDMPSPALQLQEDLLLFERIEKISMAHFTKHFNNKGQTAEKLFAANNAPLQTDAKEWLKRTSENCSIVAVLIATVAFAAAYTVPGGPNQTTGYPLLLSHPFFVIFTLTDVLSLTFALTSVITFLSILTSSFRLKDFKHSLPQRLMIGVTLLIFSVSMMMFAFAATVILMISNKQQWERIALYSVAFFPVTIFAISYLPLYLSLMKTFEYTLKKIMDIFPRFQICKSQTKIASSDSQYQATSSASSTRPHAIQATRYPV